MAKFKINKNQKDLPDELINRHKDFGKLLDNHQKFMKYKDGTKPLYKNRGFMSFIIVLSVVLLTFIITEKENESSTSKNEDTVVSKKEVQLRSEEEIITKQTETEYADTNKSQYSSASKVIGNQIGYKKPEIEYSSFKIDPKQGAVVYYHSTRILIPPFAFKDAIGNTINNEVDIKYREFKDPIDAWLADIPMHYDSTNNQFNLESAGMFEIKGFSGSQPVYLKLPVTVEMANPDHGNKYNTYFYNEKIKSWEYKGKENQSMRFMVQSDEKQYPELKPFKNMIWEFSINDQQKDLNQFKPYFSKTWSIFSVNEASTLNSIDVKLKHNSSEGKFLAYPIPVLNDAETNKKLIKAKFDEYYSLLKTKDKVEHDLADALRRQQEWLASPQGKAYYQWANSKDGQRQILSSRVVNIFSVDQFGIWNCDQPINAPQITKLTPSFKDQFGKNLNPETWYLVDYSINSVFTQYKNLELKFNPKSNNVLWAGLPEGKLAIFSKEKFKSINKSSGDYTFNMEVVDINGKDVNEIKSLLGMKAHVTAKAETKDKDPVATYERVIQLKKGAKANEVFFEKDSLQINSNIKIKTNLK